MPCYSTVQRTQMTDEARLAEALEALGYRYITRTDTHVSGQSEGGSLSFERNRAGQPFTTTANTEALRAIQRKYSELGVRQWAKGRGFSVAASENEGRKLTLINRRGG